MDCRTCLTHKDFIDFYPNRKVCKTCLNQNRNKNREENKLGLKKANVRNISFPSEKVKIIPIQEFHAKIIIHEDKNLHPSIIPFQPKIFFCKPYLNEV